MPWYEYVRTCACRPEKEDRVVSIEERDEQKCECGAALKRLPSIPGQAQWKCECPTASGGK